MWKLNFLLFLILMLGGIAGCSSPASMIPAVEDSLTQGQAQTVSALQSLTSAAVVILTDTPAPKAPAQTKTLQRTENSPTPVETPAIQVLTTQPESDGSPGSRCELARAGRPIDITVPDDTRFTPGEYFSKTWRLVNAGTCTWNADYAAVWFSGTDMGLVRKQPFNVSVSPGESVDITVEMVAPIQPGTYQSNWKLRGAQDQLFGIGPNGDSPFWVRIVVVPLYTATPTQLPPTATPTPEIVASGFSALKMDELIDLDTGQFNQPENNDLAFAFGEDEKPYLIPANGGRFVHFGSTVPGIDDCRLAPVGEAPIPFESLQAGTYLCYRTSQGLPGRMYFSTVDVENNLLNLEFVTWALP